jgi:hypothetical protein
VFLHGQRAREDGRIALRYPNLAAALRQALDL